MPFQTKTVTISGVGAVELKDRTYGVIGHLLDDGAGGFNLVLEESIQRDIGQRIIGRDPVNLSLIAATHLASAVVAQLEHEGSGPPQTLRREAQGEDVFRRRRDYVLHQHEECRRYAVQQWHELVARLRRGSHFPDAG
jgi:hypothetical protein